MARPRYHRPDDGEAYVPQMMSTAERLQRAREARAGVRIEPHVPASPPPPPPRRELPTPTEEDPPMATTHTPAQTAAACLDLLRRKGALTKRQLFLSLRHSKHHRTAVYSVIDVLERRGEVERDGETYAARGPGEPAEAPPAPPAAVRAPAKPPEPPAAPAAPAATEPTAPPPPAAPENAEDAPASTGAGVITLIELAHQAPPRRPHPVEEIDIKLRALDALAARYPPDVGDLLAAIGADLRRLQRHASGGA